MIKQEYGNVFFKALKAFLFTVILFVSLIGVAAAIFCPSKYAFAISLEEATAKVEETSAVYNEALKKQENLQKEIDSLISQIEDIESRLPDIEKEAGDAMKAMYKTQSSSDSIVSSIIGMQKLSDAIKILDFYDHIVNYQNSKLESLVSAKKELTSNKEKLDLDKEEADAAVVSAKEALDNATAARKEAQAKVKAASSGASVDLVSQIDWGMSREEFVSEWASRIDKYLSGTPLSGNGENFADAAYRYGADPRWSPAISRIESGCGSVCFRPHNAWGWMGKSFSNWEDAIDAHVKYLSGPLYGGYISMKAAQIYCPPTAGEWYSKVSREMEKM